jgi:hypothetical protein
MPPLSRIAWIPIALLALAPPAQAACPGLFELRVVMLVNEERALEDLPPLGIDDRLTAAAQGHAGDMAKKNFVSHTGSNGSVFDQRILKKGYPNSAMGENVAGGQPSPESVVAGWMASSGHRANILRASFTHIGVGYAWRSNTTYRHHWSQSFGGASTLVAKCGASGPEAAQARCQSAQLAALGKLCLADLKCHAKRAKKPAASNATTKLASCFGRAETKFAKSWGKAAEQAAGSLTLCALDQSAGAALDDFGGEIDALVGPVVLGEDAGYTHDGKLRSTLLSGAGKLCGSLLGAEAKHAASPNPGKRDATRSKARTRFDKKTSKAHAKALDRGVAYAGPSPAALGDSTETLGDETIAHTAP